MPHFFCLLSFFKGVFLLFSCHCWHFSWAKKCFLVKEPCNRITLRMGFDVKRESVAALGISMHWDFTQSHSDAAVRCTRVLSGARAYVLTFGAHAHELVCKRLCSPMPRGAHAPLGFERCSPLLGPGRVLLCCNRAAQRMGMMWRGREGGDFLCCLWCSGWTPVSSVGLQWWMQCCTFTSDSIFAFSSTWHTC